MLADGACGGAGPGASVAWSMLSLGHKHIWASKMGVGGSVDTVELGTALQSAVANWGGGLAVGETPPLMPWKVVGAGNWSGLDARCQFWS